MPYFTYILFSDKTKRYYIGSSQDIPKRLERHNAGATKSTKTGRPWRLVYSEKFDSRSDAIKRENNLKKMKSKFCIETLILKNPTT